MNDMNEEVPSPGGEAPCPRRSRVWLGYLALLALVLAAPFVPVLLAPAGRVLGNPECDNPQGYYYINHFAGYCWRQGIVPLWNPYVMLGIPFVGDGEASVFHPLSALFVFLRTGVAINWLVAISFVLTGLFYYGYLRALGLGRPAAACGTLAFTFSSVLISRVYAGHLNILLTLISMPLIFMLWEKYRDGGGVRHLAGIALAYGLMILAYYPLVLYIFSLFFLCYVVLQCLFSVHDAQSAVREVRRIAALGFFILLGTGVGAMQLLPSLDFLGRSYRAEATIEFCGMFSFPPENLLTLLVPRFFGFDIDPDSATRYWGRCFFWEMWLYIGMLPLVMAGVGAWTAPRRRSATLLICTVLFVIVALGKNTPLFPVLYGYVPMFDAFRGSSKYMIVPVFCLATLAAYGFEWLFAEHDAARRRRVRIAVLVCCGVLLAAVVTLYLVFVHGADAPGSRWERLLAWLAEIGRAERYVPFEVDAATRRATAGNAALGLAWAAVFILLSAGAVLAMRAERFRMRLLPVIALLIVADLMGMFLPMMKTYDVSITRYGTRFDELVRAYPYPPRILHLSNPWPNIAMYHKYSSVFGYTGNTLQRYNDFLTSIQGLSTTSSMSTPMHRVLTDHFGKLAVDAIVLDEDSVPQGANVIGRFGDKALVQYSNFPRVFLAAGPRYVQDRDEALEYVLSDADILSFPSVELGEGRLKPIPLEQNETVNYISHRPGRVELEARSNHPRKLVLCSMYSRHWTATVNGQPVRVVPANFVFRAVTVPAGVSKVVFEYKPAPFYQGAAVTGISLALLLAISAGAALVRRMRRTTAGPS